MDLHEYEVVAKYYDLYVDSLCGDNGMDNESCVKFHVELAEKYGGQFILDIGCGTGNTTIPLLEKGYQVDSLDISNEMINVLRKKILNSDINPKQSVLHVGNMKDFRIEKTFSLAMIPRSDFMHLLTSDEQKDTLRNINRHLTNDGILTLNTFDPDIEVIAANKPGNKKFFKRTEFINHDGNPVELYNSISFAPEYQMIENFWMFKEYDGERLIREYELPLKMRYTFRQEMIHLFELTGYEIFDIFGSYRKEKPEYPSQLIWVVRKYKTT